MKFWSHAHKQKSKANWLRENWIKERKGEREMEKNTSTDEELLGISFNLEENDHCSLLINFIISMINFDSLETHLIKLYNK